MPDFESQSWLVYFLFGWPVILGLVIFYGSFRSERPEIQPAVRALKCLPFIWVFVVVWGELASAGGGSDWVEWRGVLMIPILLAFLSAIGLSAFAVLRFEGGRLLAAVFSVGLLALIAWSSLIASMSVTGDWL